MEKKFLIVLATVVALLSLTGCDFFRRLAGRPDSEWIEAKAEAIRLEEESIRARQDSLDKIVKSVSDSLAEADSVRNANHRYRFCIILGSFSNKENAERYVEEIAAEGYKGVLLAFRNSTAVGVCQTDDEAQAKKSLEELQKQDFCPKGAWILERK